MVQLSRRLKNHWRIRRRGSGIPALQVCFEYFATPPEHLSPLKASLKASPTSHPRSTETLRNSKARLPKNSSAPTEKFLVLIDDIDRLTSEEIRQLFRVVKAVGDFPNVIYLLAFDKKVAITALAQAQGVPGEEYLEKIVQVPFELPLPDQTMLQKLLFERLDEIMVDTPEEGFDHAYWAQVYFRGISTFIGTPRDVVRFTNTLRVTYPAVHGEVNPVDFIAIEALRVFLPDVYETVRRNPSMFAGHAEMRTHGVDQSAVLKQFHAAWLDHVDDHQRDAARALVGQYSPRRGTPGPTYSTAQDRKASGGATFGCAALTSFPCSFRLAIAPGAISRAEVLSLLRAASDQKKFEGALLSYSAETGSDGVNRARSLLERLQDHTAADIPTGAVQPVVSALANVADRLIAAEASPRGLFELGIDVQSGRVFWQLARRLPAESERFAMIMAAFSQGTRYIVGSPRVSILGQEHSEDKQTPTPPEGSIVSKEHLAELEAMAVGRIREVAEVWSAARRSVARRSAVPMARLDRTRRGTSLGTGADCDRRGTARTP